MNGEIEVESVYGKGSTFTILVSQKVAGADKIGDFTEKCSREQNESEIYRASFRAPEAKVLIVDDNEMNLFVVQKLLERTQVQMTTCMSGKECLSLMQKEHYDVILLDHMMPEMDGIETLKASKELERNLCINTPVIALTANAMAGVREKYLAEGFDDYLSKPIKGNALEDMLKKYIPAELQKKQEGCLDIKTGMQYCGNSAEVYLEMLTMFCNSMEEKRKKLDESLEAEEFDQYIIHIHALKSASLSIGGKIVSREAAELEKAGKQGKYDTIREKHKQVMHLYELTAAEAEKYLQLKQR